MKSRKFEPWEEYPNIWKTEATFWAWLRGGLRRGLWEKSPIKISYKNSKCKKPPAGIDTRAKTGDYCALTGEWIGKSKLQVDHIEGNMPLRSVEDITNFIMHLVPRPGSLQLVGIEAHKVKSYAEKMGVSFEEARAQKEAIKIIKKNSVDKQKSLLLEYGYSDIGNAAKRRKCFVDHFRKTFKAERSKT